MSFRRQVFDAVGGFLEGMGRVGGDDQVLAGLTSMRTSKPAYIHGCDETELCIRFRQHWSSGLLIYEPLARVYHQVPQNRSTWDYFIARCYLEGVSKALL